MSGPRVNTRSTAMKHVLLLALVAWASASPAAILPESTKIDELLSRHWEKQGLKPNAPASEETLVRRLYLDIAGRVPTVEEAETFLNSRDPQKRTKLIDQLLAGDGFTSHMFNYWADVLRLTDNVKGRVTAQAYEEWLKGKVKANTPFDQLVRELITTEGGVWDSGAIGFYMRDENQLDHLASLGYFDTMPAPAAQRERLVDPLDDANPDLSYRVRSYFEANCAHCHVEAGGGNARIDLAAVTARERMMLDDQMPVHAADSLIESLDVGAPIDPATLRLIAPGAPERSVLWLRAARRGPGQMPPIASNVADPLGVELLRRWILEETPPPVTR